MAKKSLSHGWMSVASSVIRVPKFEPGVCKSGAWVSKNEVALN
jgi:hypothetical protein